MPSSKKNRARQRKAKKEQLSEQQQASAQYVLSLFGGNNCFCVHYVYPHSGIPLIVIDAHKLYMKAAGSGKLIISAIEDVRREFPNILEDKDLCSLLKGLIVSVGTAQLIKENLDEAYYHAVAVLTLEDHPTSPPKKFLVELSRKTGYFKAWRDLKGDRKICVTKFFWSRITCTCLSQANEDLEMKQHMGICYWCKQEKPFCTLMDCIGCEIARYCSEECRKFHLPRHKGFCTMIQTTCLECKKRPTTTTK